MAHLIDSVILNLVAWGFELLLDGFVLPADLNPWIAQVIGALLYIGLAAPYLIWGQYRYGTTLGKWPLGIYVVNASDGTPITARQSALRFFGYLVSYLPMGCGFLMAAYQPRKRALHDLIAGTVSVIKKA